ncbi:MAG: thioredoxin [Buchnera aphidicola (Chaetogeoica yunlongensis)]
MDNYIIELSDSTFKQYILESKKMILLDFWADWCTPCKILAPILEEVAREYKDKLIIAKINVDLNPKIVLKYAIRGIPALLLFKNSKLMDTKIGSISKHQLNDFLKTNLE